MFTNTPWPRFNVWDWPRTQNERQLREVTMTNSCGAICKYRRKVIQSKFQGLKVFLNYFHPTLALNPQLQSEATVRWKGVLNWGPSGRKGDKYFLAGTSESMQKMLFQKLWGWQSSWVLLTYLGKQVNTLLTELTIYLFFSYFVIIFLCSILTFIFCHLNIM